MYFAGWAISAVRRRWHQRRNWARQIRVIVVYAVLCALGYVIGENIEQKYICGAHLTAWTTRLFVYKRARALTNKNYSRFNLLVTTPN